MLWLSIKQIINSTEIISLNYCLTSFPLAIHLVSSGKVNVKPLITHRYKLEDALEAFETARTCAGGAIKVQIECFEQ